MGIPYGMFDRERTDREVRAARSLERVYHHGQRKIWNGKHVLDDLVTRHGGVDLPPDKLGALRRIFAIIMWGEMAAWKISAELAAALEPMEARLAATSQTHDEARHFYVMHDYLALLGYEPSPLDGAAHRLLTAVTGTGSLAKKLLGMQLMIEPVAITLFQTVRKTEVEPVLCELLTYYERDEARHIALGVNYLPHLLRQMPYHQLALLWAWQLRLLFLQVDELKEIEDDLRLLGIDPLEVFAVAERKQIAALEETLEQTGMNIPYFIEPFRKAVHLKRDGLFRSRTKAR